MRKVTKILLSLCLTQNPDRQSSCKFQGHLSCKPRNFQWNNFYHLFWVVDLSFKNGIKSQNRWQNLFQWKFFNTPKNVFPTNVHDWAEAYRAVYNIWKYIFAYVLLWSTKVRWFGPQEVRMSKWETVEENAKRSNLFSSGKRRGIG